MSAGKEKNKIEDIRQNLLKTGFPTEIEIGNLLRKAGWIVINQMPYIDKISKKIRPIDVSALKMSSVTGPFYQIIVECKKSEGHYWAFYSQEKDKEFLPAICTIVEFVKKIINLTTNENLRNLLSEYQIQNLFNPTSSASELIRKLGNLHILDTNIKIGVICSIAQSKKDGKKENKDEYEATQQILSALNSALDFQKNSVVFPVIVFDGELYEFYQESQDIKVLPIDHIQVVCYLEGMSTCMIDIVRKTYFPEFIKKVEKDIEIYSQFLSVQK